MSVYNKQIGGTHYKKMKIQPSKFVIQNKLLFPEGNVIKYICRHPYKNGKEDLIDDCGFINTVPCTLKNNVKIDGFFAAKLKRND